MNQAINQAIYVIYWYEANKVGFIQKYSYLTKKWPKNTAHAHIWACVFGHNSAIFCANWAENFYGNPRDYYLSIGGEKSKLLCLFFSFDFLDHFWRENGRGHHKQKVGPLGERFG